MSTNTATLRFRPIAADQSIDISNRVCSMRYETSEMPSSSASFSGYQVGSIGLTRYESQGLEHGIRTLEHVRDNPFDFFILCMPLHARFQFNHAGIQSDISKGAAVLLTAQRPFEAYVSGSLTDDRHSSLQVRIPGALLRGRMSHVDQLCNRSFSTTTSAGSVLNKMLLALLRAADGLSPIQGQHHGHAVADLIASCLYDIGGEAIVRKGSTSADMVFDKAMSFIECQLSAINLDTELVANHCRVSSRYLHAIFARHSLSVSGQIRENRLQHCRNALLNPRMAHQSIIEIACRWGFSDPSHFGRVYRKRFGLAPSEERAASCH